MAKISVELDQQLTSEVNPEYGTLAIRVVVVSPKPVKKGEKKPPAEIPSEFDDDQPEDDDDEGTGAALFLP